MHQLGPRRLVDTFVAARVGLAEANSSFNDDLQDFSKRLFVHHKLVYPSGRSQNDMVQNILMFCLPSTDFFYEKKPIVFSFVLTDGVGNKQYASCLVDPLIRVVSGLPTASGASSESLNLQVSSGQTPRLVSLFCLLSSLPLLNTMELLLWEFYKLLQTSHHSIIESAERFAWRLHHEILMPPQGEISVEFTLPLTNRKWILEPYSHSGLPLADVYFTMLFDRLGVGNLIRILSGLMIEESVIVWSKSYVDLTHVCEALFVLLQPFEWRMVYVPVLPTSLAERVTSISVVFMGVSSASVTEHLDDIEKKALRVDLDNDQVWSSDPPLLFPNASRTIANLQRLERQWRIDVAHALPKQRHSTERHEHNYIGELHLMAETQAFINAVREEILDDVFCYLLGNYRSYIAPDGTFNTADFTKPFMKNEQAFVKRFVETSMFSEFVERKLPSPTDSFQPNFWTGFDQYLGNYQQNHGLGRTSTAAVKPSQHIKLSYPPHDNEKSLLNLLSEDDTRIPENLDQFSMAVFDKLSVSGRHPMRNIMDYIDTLARSHHDHMNILWLHAFVYEEGMMLKTAFLDYTSLANRYPSMELFLCAIARLVVQLTEDEVSDFIAAVVDTFKDASAQALPLKFLQQRLEQIEAEQVRRIRQSREETEGWVLHENWNEASRSSSTNSLPIQNSPINTSSAVSLASSIATIPATLVAKVNNAATTTTAAQKLKYYRPTDRRVLNVRLSKQSSRHASISGLVMDVKVPNPSALVSSIRSIIPNTNDANPREGSDLPSAILFPAALMSGSQSITSLADSVSSSGEASPIKPATPATTATPHSPTIGPNKSPPTSPSVSGVVDPLTLSIDLTEKLIAIFKANTTEQEDSTTLIVKNPKILETIRDSEEYQVGFKSAVTQLDKVNLDSMSQIERLCFFLNIHNVLCMHVFIEYLVPNGFFSRVELMYNKLVYDIGGNYYSVSQLEHSIICFSLSGPDLSFFIRPLLLRSIEKLTPRDPRWNYRITDVNPLVRFLLADGTVSSSRVTVYWPETLQQQLKSEAEWFFSRNVTFNPARKTVDLPMLFKWYIADFSKAKSDVDLLHNFITHFPDLPLSKFLNSLPLRKNGELPLNSVTIKYQPFKWDFCFRIAIAVQPEFTL